MGLKHLGQQTQRHGSPGMATAANEDEKLKIVVFRLRGELHSTRVHPHVPSSVIGTSAVVFQVEGDPTPNEENIFTGVMQKAKNRARELGLGDIYGLTC